MSTITHPRPRIAPAETDSSWRRDAFCVGSGVDFHPNETDLEAVFVAKVMCAQCPVREACLMNAMEARDGWAICGGTTPAERERMRRRSKR